MLNLRGRLEPELEIKPVIDRSHLIGYCGNQDSPICYQNAYFCKSCNRRWSNAYNDPKITDHDYYKGKE